MTKATKIVCTLGPACSEPAVMKAMLAAGMNVARINCSHGDHDSHRGRIKAFRSACEEMKVPPAVLLDTRGPEIRLGDFGDNKVQIKKGQKYTLFKDPKVPGTEEGVGISYPGLASAVSRGSRILIDDGKIKMEVESTKDGDVICVADDSGYLSTRKGVNVPDVHLDMEFLSERDRQDLLFGIEEEVDFVAASFVRSAEDVKAIRDFLSTEEGGDIKIISKIENTEGLKNFDEILEASDGIMVARGDMGVEVDFATLPGIQKTIIDRCNRAGKPVITATQMLESMISEPMPTRAEITDVANAVFDGTSAVMLSAESAAGKYPAASVEVMTRILKQAEADLSASPRRVDMGAMYEESLGEEGADLSTAIGHAACQIAKDIGAKAIIAITRSGYTARMISRFHPDQLIIAATPSVRVMRQMALIRGAYPVITEQKDDTEALLKEALEGAAGSGIISAGDPVVISAGFPPSVSGNTNMIRVETV